MTLAIRLRNCCLTIIIHIIYKHTIFAETRIGPQSLYLPEKYPAHTSDDHITGMRWRPSFRLPSPRQPA